MTHDEMSIRRAKIRADDYARNAHKALFKARMYWRITVCFAVFSLASWAVAVAVEPRYIVPSLALSALFFIALAITIYYMVVSARSAKYQLLTENWLASNKYNYQNIYNPHNKEY